MPRLQRILAAAGLASRRKAEQFLREGRVTINGRRAQLGESADPSRAKIMLDGEVVRAQKHRYFLLHKPRGVLSTRADPFAKRQGRRTVMMLAPETARACGAFPVGRLDLESEGLLLLTNNGAVAHALLHPSFGAEKEYRVQVRGAPSAATLRALARGPRLDEGRRMAPCKVRVLASGGRGGRDSGGGRCELALVLNEGRKRQIRRALFALGHPVVRLQRVRMGPLRLGELPRGAARELSAAEIRTLLQYVQKRGSTPT